MRLRVKNPAFSPDFVTVMPALLEPEPVPAEANLFAAAGSWPTAPPHHRHNRHDTSSRALIGSCLLLITLGIAARAWQLDMVPGVNGDEAWYGVQAQRFLDEYIYGKALPEAERVNFRTPTGNIWNPFLMIPRLVLDAMIAPSIWSLRVPALVSGVLALLVNWWLCRRALDRTTAWLTTALLAVLPIAVIYSRLGWDSCQSILFCLPLVYLPWVAEREKLSGTRTAVYFVLALAAAMLVHPTNIFLLPVSLVLFWPRLSRFAKWNPSRQSGVIVAAAAVAAAVGLGISRGAWNGVELRNLSSVLELGAQDILGLFSGATVYGSVSLPGEEWRAAQRALLLLSLPTLGLLLWARFAGKTALFPNPGSIPARRYAALFDGTCWALLCFLGIAGPAAILPGYERYGLWLIAPGVLLIVLASTAAARCSLVASRVVTILTLVQHVLLLAGYWHYYQRRFDDPLSTQELAHWTYKTDSVATPSDVIKILEKSHPGQGSQSRQLIFILENDPQRWWFEWKWRYLTHDLELEWHVVRTVNDLESLIQHGSQGWLLTAQTANAKEKISIRYVSIRP
jgi:hypothetical protein